MKITQAQKLKFLNKLPNEDFFRKNVLIPLFQETNKFQSVYDTHGADEKGKDIVLIGRGDFDELEYTAIIVKNESITNAASAKEKEVVASVSNQIVMTINSGYDCIIQKKNVKFNKIIIVTSKTISNSARPALNKVAEDHGYPSLQFFDQDRLMNMIDEYLPEVYTVGKGGLSKYFHSLKETCEKLNEWKSISFYKGDIRDLVEVYVEPRLQRRKKKVGSADNKTENETARITQLVKSDKNCLVYGDAGAGKSTLIRSEILRLIIEYESDKSNKVPVLIKLKEFITELLVFSQQKNIEKSLIAYLTKKYNLSENEMKDILDSDKDKFLLFLDGYDELVSEEEIEQFNKVNVYLDSLVNVNYIITSRNKINVLSASSKIEDWKIQDFNTKQVKQFLQKWFKNKDARLIEALQDHNLIEQLPKTPLAMTLIAIIYDADSDVELPSNLSELYDMFTQLLLGRWSFDRRASTFHKANDKEIFLTEIAVYLHENHKISCTLPEITKVFEKTEKKMGRKIEHSSMLSELITDTNLLIQNDRGEFEFRHLSFQEYFVAKEFSVHNKVKFLINEFPSQWWSQVLYFYCGVKKANDKLLPSLMKKILKLQDILAIKGIWQMGYLVQSSYKTHAHVRKDMILKSSEHYANTMKKAIEDYLKQNKGLSETMIYLSIADMFRLHFRSKYLVDIYTSVYHELIKKNDDGFISGLSILLICNVLAELGEIEYLADSEKYYKNFPLLVIMEDIELGCCLELEQKDKEKKKAIRRISAKLMAKMKKDPSAYKKYLAELK